MVKNNLEHRKKYRKQHKKEIDEYNKKWYKIHKEYFRKACKEERKKLKMEVLTHYSNGIPKCANIYNFHKEEITDIRCLQIDHIKGRNTKLPFRSGGDLYHWLKRNNYPKGYQVLCCNCNWIKRYENKECGYMGMGFL